MAAVARVPPSGASGGGRAKRGRDTDAPHAKGSMFEKLRAVNETNRLCAMMRNALVVHTTAEKTIEMDDDAFEEAEINTDDTIAAAFREWIEGDVVQVEAKHRCCEATLAFLTLLKLFPQLSPVPALSSELEDVLGSNGMLPPGKERVSDFTVSEFAQSLADLGNCWNRVAAVPGMRTVVATYVHRLGRLTQTMHRPDVFDDPRYYVECDRATKEFIVEEDLEWSQRQRRKGDLNASLPGELETEDRDREAMEKWRRERMLVPKASLVLDHEPILRDMYVQSVFLSKAWDVSDDGPRARSVRAACEGVMQTCHMMDLFYERLEYLWTSHYGPGDSERYQRSSPMLKLVPKGVLSKYRRERMVTPSTDDCDSIIANARDVPSVLTLAKHVWPDHIKLTPSVQACDATPEAATLRFLGGKLGYVTQSGDVFLHNETLPVSTLLASYLVARGVAIALDFTADETETEPNRHNRRRRGDRRVGLA